MKKQQKSPEQVRSEAEKLTPQQQRWAIWGALKAALFVALIFGGAYFLFILFCDNIWLK